MKIKIAAGVVLIAAILAMQLSTFTTQVQAQANCEGEWARLYVYAGSYDTDALLNDSDVKAAISKMLGDETEHFLDNLSVRGMADLIGCNLVLEGNADHAGGEENALLVVELGRGAITAGMLTGGRIRIYTTWPDYASLPLALKDWIAVISSGFNFRFDPPANADVIIVTP